MVSNAPNYCRRVEVFVGNLARQQLPQNDAVAPNVNLEWQNMSEI